MNSSTPIRALPEALKRIDEFTGAVGEFRLPIHNSMLDPIGLNMALVTDRILARGWEPDGFDACMEGRVFRYKEFE